MPDDEISIDEIQTVTVRERKSQHGNSIVVSLTPAIRAAGLESGGWFRFQPGAVDEIGMLPALGFGSDEDVSEGPLTRKILFEGSGTIRLHVPEEALEAIPGFPEIDAIEWDDPPELTVFAGDRMLAFELAESRSVTINRDVDDEGVDGDTDESDREASNG
jgi:hypothetical protein